jgi:hypothetical protein
MGNSVDRAAGLHPDGGLACEQAPGPSRSAQLARRRPGQSATPCGPRASRRAYRDPSPAVNLRCGEGGFSAIRGAIARRRAQREADGSSNQAGYPDAADVARHFEVLACTQTDNAKASGRRGWRPADRGRGASRSRMFARTCQSEAMPPPSYRSPKGPARRRRTRVLRRTVGWVIVRLPGFTGAVGDRAMDRSGGSWAPALSGAHPSHVLFA